jgi:hypothetical protein
VNDLVITHEGRRYSFMEFMTMVEERRAADRLAEKQIHAIAKQLYEEEKNL